MKHILKYERFNESSKASDIDSETILQAIGILKNPKNEEIGTPTQYSIGKPLNKESLVILKGMTSGVNPDESDLEKIEGLIKFVYELQERAEKDQSVKTYLVKYKQDGEKEMNLLKTVKKTLDLGKFKREKNPLFGE